MKKKFNFKRFKGGPTNFLLLGLLFLLSIASLTKLIDIKRSVERIGYSDLVSSVKQGKVKTIRFVGSEAFGVYKDNNNIKRFEVIVPKDDQSLKSLLEKNDVKISYEVPSTSDLGWWNILMLLALIFVPVGIWFFMRRSKGGSSSGSSTGIFSMGKSKAKMFMPSQIKVNFNSVAGVKEAKEELKEVVDFLKSPDKYKKLGAKLTKGVLLVGEPGNGKTLLAKAVAGEANCPFFSISGSDFIEVFVGVGASRVRDLFAQARKHAPSIIFIDEIDAVGRQRGNGMGGGHDEREQTLNQLLSEMDGFNTEDSSVVVIAATNRADVLDKALTRAGRFDRKVHVPYPDLDSRESILRIHSSKIKLSPSIDIKRYAKGTPGFSGADLANLVNEAAIYASIKNKNSVEIEDIEEAKDKIMLKGKKRVRPLTEDDKKIVAYHEAGHALVGLLSPNNKYPLHKVTILPRGSALGVAYFLEDKTDDSLTKNQLIADIMKSLGGRAAEELIFQDVTTGAAGGDFVNSTQKATMMVRVYGMSDELGPVTYQDNQISEYTSKKIDEEVRKLIKKLYQDTVNLLTNNIDMLHKLANALIEKETLTDKEVKELLGLDIEPKEESTKDDSNSDISITDQVIGKA